MTEAIYEWMQNLAFFFLFMTAILNCLPDNKYRKYVQFFLGLVLMIVLCKPLLQVLDLDTLLNDKLSSATLEQEVENSRNSAFTVEGVQEDLLNQAYEKEIESQIKVMLEEKGITVQSAEVKLNKGENVAVDRISLEVTNSEESMYQEDEEKMDQEFQKKLNEVRSELSQVYEVDESHIDISR